MNIPKLKLICSVALFFSVLSSQAQDAAVRYPTKPIEFIVPAPAGGASDVVARLIAERLSRSLGQPVVVNNKAGASQTLGSAAVARAEPDGYTMLFTTSTPIVMSPITMKGVRYDVKRDFVTVAHIGATPLVMYVNSGFPATSIKSLVDRAKSSPGVTTYGSYGTGSSAHVLVEYFSKQANIKMLHVPYKGTAPLLSDLAGGQVNMGVSDVGTSLPFVTAGKIKPIAVTGTKRSAVYPDVPTFAEQGISGMEPFSPWWGLFSPAKTPAPIVEMVSSEIIKIVNMPEIKARLSALGIEPNAMATAQANDFTHKEYDQWKKIIDGMQGINFE